MVPTSLSLSLLNFYYFISLPPRRLLAIIRLHSPTATITWITAIGPSVRANGLRRQQIDSMAMAPRKLFKMFHFRKAYQKSRF